MIWLWLQKKVWRPKYIWNYAKQYCAKYLNVNCTDRVVVIKFLTIANFQAFKSDLELKWVEKFTWIVEHNNIGYSYPTWHVMFSTWEVLVKNKWCILLVLLSGCVCLLCLVFDDGCMQFTLWDSIICIFFIFPFVLLSQGQFGRVICIYFLKNCEAIRLLAKIIFIHSTILKNFHFLAGHWAGYDS